MNNQNISKQRQIWKSIDLFLEDFYPQSKLAGQELKQARMDHTQVRGLENLVVSTRRFSEILNYIKNQAGKSSNAAKKWQKVAGLLLNQLATLENKGKELGDEDPELIMESKLRLARGWIKQVVSQYLFLNVRSELEEG